MDIYSLTSEYKQVVATESDASLRSCEILFAIKEAALARAPSENSKEYKKAIATFRNDVGLSKSQFNKDVAVGGALARVASNEIRSLTKHAIYKQYCVTPKPPKEKKPKDTVDWKSKYESLSEGYSLLLSKYEESIIKNKKLQLIIDSYDA